LPTKTILTTLAVESFEAGIAAGEAADATTAADVDADAASALRFSQDVTVTDKTNKAKIENGRINSSFI
jgi:hypothetical protein